MARYRYENKDCFCASSGEWLFSMAALFVGLTKFIGDMQKLPASTTLWAALFPFPQLLVGGYLAATRGVASPAAWIFGARAISFLIAGQVSLRHPLTKLMGPMMHTPFLLAVPLSLRWLASDASARDVNMSRFVTYTCTVTLLSLVLDIWTALQWAVGRDVGTYKQRKGGRAPKWILPLPSLALAALKGLFAPHAALPHPRFPGVAVVVRRARASRAARCHSSCLPGGQRA